MFLCGKIQVGKVNTKLFMRKEVYKCRKFPMLEYESSKF